jgi:hypothetical protein
VHLSQKISANSFFSVRRFVDVVPSSISWTRAHPSVEMSARKILGAAARAVGARMGGAPAPSTWTRPAACGFATSASAGADRSTTSFSSSFLPPLSMTDVEI